MKMSSKEICEACGEDIGRENTRPMILGVRRRRICSSCEDEKSKIRLKNEVESG